MLLPLTAISGRLSRNTGSLLKLISSLHPGGIPVISSLSLAEWHIGDNKASIKRMQAIVENILFRIVHVIVFIVGTRHAVSDTSRKKPSKSIRFSNPQKDSLHTIIGSYKSAVTKSINQMKNTPGSKVWQSRFFEHVIRNEEELSRIRQYIIDNPKKWELDKDNPINIK